MNATTISNDMHFQGEVYSDDKLVISGNIEGVLRGKSTVLIEESGNVHGDLYVRQLDHKGKIQGNIHGADLVHIFAGGNIAGDIETKEMHMEKSARHNGSTIMK